MPVAAAVELSDQDFLVFTQSGPNSEVSSTNKNGDPEAAAVDSYMIPIR